MKMVHTRYANTISRMEAECIGRLDKDLERKRKRMKSMGIAVDTVHSEDKLDVPVVNSTGKAVGSMPNDSFWRITSMNRINGKEYYKVDNNRYVLKKYVAFKGGMNYEDNYTSK